MMEIDVGAVLIGAGLALFVVAAYVWYLWRRMARRIDQLVRHAVEDNLVGLDIELERDMFFCYNSKDKQFVCQGATVEEVRRAFGRRYPDKTAYLAGGDPTAVENFKTELLRLATDENSSSK
jgi:HAMP domain-containing protein